MRILFVTSEIDPLVKTGGLADVSATLPRALRTLGVDVRILIPGYPSVLDGLSLETLAEGVALLPGQSPGRLLAGTLPHGQVPVFVLDCPHWYQRDGGPYQDNQGLDWPDNAQRFGALSRAGALLASDATPIAWLPDVIHCNDWQSGLAPAYLAFHQGARARALVSVHNIAFAGRFPPTLVPALGLPAQGFSLHGFEYFGDLSFLKAALYYADHITTVSPRYALEIQTEAYGGGFHGLLTARREALTGILNGIDTERWDPATDAHLARRYGASRLHLKRFNKAALQARTGLVANPDVPLLGFIGRLTHQKGVDLLPEALRALGEQAFQLIVLGAGDRVLEARLRTLENEYPRQIAVSFGFDESLAHQIEAGADVFLMPSRFEPCGLNQMYSMRYGTPPVARHTGGLADTITDASAASLREGTATGFLFDEPEPLALASCIQRALDMIVNKRAWRRLQRAGMEQDFSWEASASTYRTLYRQLLS